jgi:NAD(P)-dependent dehydrogenase (short-subunit alcohol dehydrogenase family)
MVAAVPKEALDKVVAKIPVGRLGDAEEVARVVEFPRRPRLRLHHRTDLLRERRTVHVSRRREGGPRSGPPSAPAHPS